MSDINGFAEFIADKIAGTTPYFPEDSGEDEIPLYFRDRDARQIFFAFGQTAEDALNIISRIPGNHKRTWILTDGNGVARIGIECSRQAAECLREWTERRE